MPHQPTATPPPDRRPAESPSAEPRSLESRSTESCSPGSHSVESHSTERLAAVAWPRVVRLGAPRPGPAARRARWFGVPLVPLFLAALVVGGFMAVGGGEDFEGPADGRPGGGPVAVPSPVVTAEDTGTTSVPTAGAPSPGEP
ncbi:hypothetical protein ACFWVF_37495, partial [Streptomyces sp. NPDC058659]